MTAAHKRGERQRGALSVFLESLGNKNEVFPDESGTVLLVDRRDELGRTEEDARRKRGKWLADAEIHSRDGWCRALREERPHDRAQPARPGAHQQMLERSER
eukprot:11935822-Alexandrium_andersonii.AAC.1